MFLSFSKLAPNEKAFFIQFYGERDWVHQKIAANDKYYGSCIGDYKPIEELLQCPRRKVWLHSNCFFNWLWEGGIKY